MAYDTSKLTTLGQIKLALQRVANAITSAKSTRQVVTILKSNWVLDDNVYRYPSILTTSNYNYYNVHLDPESASSTSLMCANADIRVRIVNSELRLYCYNMPSDPSQFDNFQLEIITTPTKSNDVGLSYDIGDDFLVYPQITDQLSARIDGLGSDVNNMLLCANSVPVVRSKWQDSGTTTEYRYYATINMSGVTAEHFAIVQFDNLDSAIMSPNVTTGLGAVTIYASEIPAASIVIPHILCYKATTSVIS